MTKNINGRFAEMKDRLTKLGEHEPLSALSFIAILLLDVFVLVILFWWLADTTKGQLTTPENLVPYTCQNIAFHADTKTDLQKLDLVGQSIMVQKSRTNF